MGRLSWIIWGRGAEYTHKGSYKSKGETEGPGSEKARAVTEAEVRAMALLAVKMQGGAVSHGRGCLENLGQVRKQSLPCSLQKGRSTHDTLNLARETHFRPLIARTMR